MSAIVQRRRNRISCIKNDARKWIHNEREIVEFIRRGFDRLFMSSLDSVPLTPPQPLSGNLPYPRRRRIPFACLFLMMKSKMVFGQ